MVALYILVKLSKAASYAILEDKMKVVFSQAQDSDQAFIDVLCDLCSALRVGIAKDREMVTCDSVRDGVLEQLLASAYVGMRLKAGYAADMEETG
ncbi:hypothetical protein Tco_0111964 [Tanacetum coccineum]